MSSVEQCQIRGERNHTNFVTPKHPGAQRVFVSFDVGPAGYLAHEFSVVV